MDKASGIVKAPDQTGHVRWIAVRATDDGVEYYIGRWAPLPPALRWYVRWDDDPPDPWHAERERMWAWADYLRENVS